MDMSSIDSFGEQGRANGQFEFFSLHILIPKSRRQLKIHYIVVIADFYFNVPQANFTTRIFTT